MDDEQKCAHINNDRPRNTENVLTIDIRLWLEKERSPKMLTYNQKEKDPP